MWPSSNEEYWREKITRNVTRDRENYEQLKNIGWNIYVVWECQLKKKDFETTMNKLICFLTEMDTD